MNKDIETNELYEVLHNLLSNIKDNNIYPTNEEITSIYTNGDKYLKEEIRRVSEIHIAEKRKLGIPKW